MNPAGPGVSVANDKKQKDRKAKDDFYDRINYYESRNIFSSNEHFNPNNRLYTDNAAHTHSVWNTIHTTDKPPSLNNFDDIGRDVMSSEITQNLLNNLNKFSSSSSSAGCRHCGYGKHNLNYN